MIFEVIIQKQIHIPNAEMSKALSQKGKKKKHFYIQNFKLVDSMSFTFVSLCIIFDVFLAFNLKKKLIYKRYCAFI